MIGPSTISGKKAVNLKLKMDKCIFKTLRWKRISDEHDDIRIFIKICKA